MLSRQAECKKSFEVRPLKSQVIAAFFFFFFSSTQVFQQEKISLLFTQTEQGTLLYHCIQQRFQLEAESLNLKKYLELVYSTS